MAPRVIFRCDASPAMGGGHVRRCLVLAEELSADGWEVAFATQPQTLEAVPFLRRSKMKVITLAEEEGADAVKAGFLSGCNLLVVDHYGLDRAFEKACRSWAEHILVIDDLADRPHDCDELVDQTPNRDPADYRCLVPTDCVVKTGADYALLDRRFRDARARILPRSGSVNRILVNFGSTDPDGATELALIALQRASLGIPVDVVLGSDSVRTADIRRLAAQLRPAANVHVSIDDMADLIAGCDFAIGAGGVGALERCCLSVPSIIVILAENQRGNAEAMATRGAAVATDRAMLQNAEEMSQLVIELIDDRLKLVSMALACNQLVDGAGVLRVSAQCRAMACSSPS